MTAIVNGSDFSIKTNGVKIKSSSAVAVIDNNSTPLTLDQIQQNEALSKLLGLVPQLSQDQTATKLNHEDDRPGSIYISTPLQAMVVRFAREFGQELESGTKQSHAQRLEQQRAANTGLTRGAA